MPQTTTERAHVLRVDHARSGNTSYLLPVADFGRNPKKDITTVLTPDPEKAANFRTVDEALAAWVHTLNVVPRDRLAWYFSRSVKPIPVVIRATTDAPEITPLDEDVKFVLLASGTGLYLRDPEVRLWAKESVLATLSTDAPLIFDNVWDAQEAIEPIERTHVRSWEIVPVRVTTPEPTRSVKVIR